MTDLEKRLFARTMNQTAPMQSDERLQTMADQAAQPQAGRDQLRWEVFIGLQKTNPLFDQTWEEFQAEMDRSGTGF